jgi:hypothetical protein
MELVMMEFYLLNLLVVELNMGPHSSEYISFIHATHTKNSKGTNRLSSIKGSVPQIPN